MRNVTLGSMIRELRKRAKLTQEELSLGICSSVSISRIETGVQMPSGKVLDAILSRLGTSTYQICNVYYKSDRQLEFEKEADIAAEHMKNGRYDEAKLIMDSIIDRVNENRLNLQYYLLLEASLEIYRNNATEETISILKRALEITKPSFDYSDFRGVLLTYREANILSLLMIAYFRCGNVLYAIDLGKELASSMKKHKSSVKEYNTVKINATLNLSQFLEQEHRYQEALIYISEAEDFSIKLIEHPFLPEIFFFKAKVHYYMGNKEESLCILKAILPYLELINKTDFANAAKALMCKVEGRE